ncbi:MAG: hypothetical protein SVM86_04520 [Candidatus Cloacimonadota bacterium]|nr:hypothetical protein [Candidatus Cloacimonadota bacterium]
MKVRDEIRKMLYDMDMKNPGILDRYSEKDINRIPEIQAILKQKKFKKIINFKVLRKNKGEELESIKSIKFNFLI